MQNIYWGKKLGKALDYFTSVFTNRRRQANLQKGKQLLREGKISEARECFTRSVNITPSMAHDVIKVRPLYLISLNNIFLELVK